MNTRDSNSQRMARNVKEVLHQYEPVWKEKPRVAKEVNTFDSAVEKMEPHAIGSLIVTKGFTDNKDAVALEMYAEAAAIARRVSVYALDFYRDYKNARIIIDRGGSPKEEEKK